MAYKINKDWITEAGYRAVVLMCRDSHHCGYVGIPKEHPFFGKDYDEEVVPREGFFKDEPIGKRSPIDVFLAASPEEEGHVRLSLLFNVHGGITYAGGSEKYPIESDGLWWFGYDCAHSGDATIGKYGYSFGEDTFKGEGYCRKECESLATQLKGYEKSDSQEEPTLFKTEAAHAVRDGNGRILEPARGLRRWATEDFYWEWYPGRRGK